MRSRRRCAVLLRLIFLLGLLGAAPAPGEPGPAAPRPGEPATLRDGYRRYQGVCAHCHGPDGVGSTFAPGLLDPLLPRPRFRAAVRDGVATTRGRMRGFALDPSVEPYLDAIYAYLVERAAGRLGRGRPPG